MDEEGMITMTQLKTILEDFKSDIKRVTEVVQHGFAKLETKSDSHAEQIALLIEGQTMHSMRFEENAKQFAQVHEELAHVRVELADIKETLKPKADREELAALETRVTKLEHKVA